MHSLCQFNNIFIVKVCSWNDQNSWIGQNNQLLEVLNINNPVKWHRVTVNESPVKQTFLFGFNKEVRGSIQSRDRQNEIYIFGGLQIKGFIN